MDYCSAAIHMWKHTETKPHLHFSLSLFLSLCLVAKQLFSGDNLGSGISHSNKDTHNPLQYIAYSWKRKKWMHCSETTWMLHPCSCSWFFFLLYTMAITEKQKLTSCPFPWDQWFVCFFLPRRLCEQQSPHWQKNWIVALLSLNTVSVRQVCCVWVHLN